MAWTSTRRWIDSLALIGATVIAVASAFACFAREGWFAELFSHFRPQYALASLVIAVYFLARGRRRLAFATTLIVLSNAWVVSPYVLPLLVPASVAAPAGREVNVISLNLLYRNQDRAAVRDYLRDSDADVLVLSELTPSWVEALQPVTATYPYWMSMGRRSPWGLGVFSRYPLLDARADDLGVRGSVNVVARVALPGGDIELVGVHLASPSGPSRAALRNRQLANLAALLGPPPNGNDLVTVPRLVVGDMNITPFSPYFDDLLSATGLADARRVHGIHGTWPTLVPPLQIAIDHCLADPGLGVTRVARGPDVGSDHYPLEVTIRQRG